MAELKASIVLRAIDTATAPLKALSRSASGTQPCYLCPMCGSRGWHWVCGLALLPLALVMLPALDRAGETGILPWAAVFAIVYLASLLATTVFAIVGALCVVVARDLIEELVGLGG